MRVALSLFIAIFISGCSVATAPLSTAQYSLRPEESLWKLTIEQWGSEQFSGLLAVRTLGPDFHLVLLDVTGIKLLETTMSNGSDVKVVSAVKAVRNRNLPEYLSISTLRIFDTMSEDIHCFRHGLIKTCKKKPALDVERKEARFGPFLLWSVDYFSNKDVSEGFICAVLKEPWKCSKLTLELCKR